MTPNPRPISLRPPPELLARIDAAVPDSPQPNRSAWIIEACERRLVADATHDKVLAELRARDTSDADIVRGHATGTLEPGDHPRAACPYPAGCSGCTPDTVQERAARGEPDAVARMQLAGQLAPGYLTEAGLEHLRTDMGAELEAGLDADGDIAGADYPPHPEGQAGLVLPIAGADITIEVTPVAGGALWRWKVAHPDLAEPIEGSESFRSAILDSARNIVRGKVGHGDFTLRLPKGVAR